MAGRSQVDLQYRVASLPTFFVIDREVNSVEVARRFHTAGLGLLTMLDRTQYTGLSSWTTTRIGALADGSPVYEGQWATPHPDDPELVQVTVQNLFQAVKGEPDAVVGDPVLGEVVGADLS